MDQHAVKQAVTPLRMIFWGGLLCIFDITFSQTSNGHGFKFDILNDVLGTALIAIGVFRLSAIPVHDRYTSLMRFVQIVSVLAVVDAVRDHFIMPLPPLIQFGLVLFGLVCLLAIVAFCVAMRWFCQQAGLIEASRSWSVTTELFVGIYLIPLGLFYLISLGAIALDQPFHFNLGPAGLLLLIVFVIPVVHLFISTSRMQRAAANGEVERPFKEYSIPASQPGMANSIRDRARRNPIALWGLIFAICILPFAVALIVTSLHPIRSAGSEADESAIVPRPLGNHGRYGAGTTALALSADDRRLYSGSSGMIKVWDIDSETEVLSFSQHSSIGITSLALSADGKRLYSAHDTNQIRVWDVEAGTVLHTLQGHKSTVNVVTLSSDGQRLFSGSRDHTIKVWDLETFTEILTLRGHTHEVRSLALSSDNRRLYSGSEEVFGFESRVYGAIKVWDVETGIELYSLRGHTGLVSSLMLSADDKWLYSGSEDKTIKAWDLETGAVMLTLQGHIGQIKALALSSDGKWLYSGGLVSIKVWNLDGGTIALTLTTDSSISFGTSLVLTSDGKRLYSAHTNGEIKVWDIVPQ